MPPSGAAKAGIAVAVVVAAFVVIFVPIFVLHGKHTAPVEATSEPACKVAALPPKQQLPAQYPLTTKRPNIIYLLLDDLGYDDLRLHHPNVGAAHNWLHTPNLDRLVQQSTEFDNFYTSPMCSNSRAELLTGRYYPRTGSFYINTGWDFMNVNETNIAEVLGNAGYKTAVFGKWHNGRTAGYQPSDLGFADSFMPTPYVYYDNLVYINRQPVQTKGWMEEALMRMAIDYLKERHADQQPFFLYYPSFSVHAGWTTSAHAGPRFQRPAPPKYVKKYASLPISDDTASLYAMLEYIDTQVGRLLNFLESSGLAENTYVFMSGDNGPALFQKEAKPLRKEVRMPSGMQGSKHLVLEGGVRNFLAVRGPGVAQGVTNSELLGLIDVLPTVVELARVRQVVKHAPWDGLSFVNLLAAQPATVEQQERLLFFMQTQCIEDDFLPALGADRRVQKPQPLLNYYTGGVNKLGFKRCVAVRYKHFKWLGNAAATKGQGRRYKSGKKSLPTALYEFHGNDHMELPCQEVSLQSPDVASFLESAAESWFKEMLFSPHAFERPVFFLGLGDRPGVNVVGDGVLQRTPGRVQVLPMGVAGFSLPGDAAWYRIKVAQAGLYEVSLMYQSNHEATFTIAVGPYKSIIRQKALSLVANLPASPSKRTKLLVGRLELPQTAPGVTWELRLQLNHNSLPGKPVVQALDNIIFKRMGAYGVMLPYDPNDQEGVKVWKDENGYAQIQGG